jgi:hypothetical protein
MAVKAFEAENAYWIMNNSWWSSMYENWSMGSSNGGGYDNGGGGGGNGNGTGGGGYDLSTNWSQSEWQSWFKSHPASDTSALSAVQAFSSENYLWIASHSWWNSLYANWGMAAYQ